jgi:hypothetical protein
MPAGYPTHFTFLPSFSTPSKMTNHKPLEGHALLTAGWRKSRLMVTHRERAERRRKSYSPGKRCRRVVKTESGESIAVRDVRAIAPIPRSRETIVQSTSALRACAESSPQSNSNISCGMKYCEAKVADSHHTGNSEHRLSCPRWKERARHASLLLQRSIPTMVTRAACIGLIEVQVHGKADSNRDIHA